MDHYYYFPSDCKILHFDFSCFVVNRRISSRSEFNITITNDFNFS